MNDINNHKQQFDIYYQFLIEENAKYNLTSITYKDEIYHKHFVDSLSIAATCDILNIISLCDVGSGAGFPSIPLKIVYPHLHITIIEPILKRCRFLEQLVEKLKLTNVTIINSRAETQINFREKFDIVCARAVSNLPILLEVCLPLVKKEGYFLAMKGSNYQEEVMNSQNALKVLNSIIENVYEYELENDYGRHSIIKVKKNKTTSNIYPRSYAIIKNKPL